MKKITNLLFAFVIMAVGMFGFGTVNALTINKDAYYEFYMTGGNGKLKMSFIEENDDIINNAVAEFFPESSGAETVNIIPFKFTVSEGQTWTEDDIATMFINIPKIFNLEKSDHIYLLRINPTTGDKKAFDIGDKYTGDFEIKNFESIKDILSSDSVTSKGVSEKPNIYNVYNTDEVDNDYFSNQYAELETNDFESTGDTYFVLVTCQGIELPTAPEIPTTTTTIANPETGDINSKLYIVIGIIGLVGIAGLGIKFAKTDK